MWQHVSDERDKQMIHVEILTAESPLVSMDVDSVVATTIDGQVAILHGHMPFVAVLQPGELVLRLSRGDLYYSISGGFLRVSAIGVSVLADACEYAEAIDVERAEQARRRAEALLAEGKPGVDLVAGEAALRRALARLHVADRHRVRTQPRAMRMERATLHRDHADI